MSHLTPVGSSPFLATSKENINIQAITVFVLGTITTLTVAMGLVRCHFKNRQTLPVPAYWGLGQQAFEAGNFAIALQHFNDALTHRQASPLKVHYEKARAYLEMGDYEASSESCERVSILLRDAPLPLDPTRDSDLPAQLLCLQADIHLKQGKERQVIDECTRALNFRPKSNLLLLQTYLILAIAYHRSNNFLAATTYYSQATTYNIETNRAFAAIILYNQALSQHKAGLTNDAICSLEWAEMTCQELSFPSSHLRFVLPLPLEWGEKIDSSDAQLSAAEQLKKRIQKARTRIRL
ncbi:MAG: tetratricopeptide repeat protein [Verrucomicrobia bacterium]|nr:tetratricopeptide repeat protein [Verrucomicrobiota bacterium]